MKENELLDTLNRVAWNLEVDGNLADANGVRDAMKILESIIPDEARVVELKDVPFYFGSVVWLDSRYDINGMEATTAIEPIALEGRTTVNGAEYFEYTTDFISCLGYMTQYVFWNERPTEEQRQVHWARVRASA